VEAVENGVTGLLVPKRNGPALAEAILRLMRNPEYAAEMGRKARELIREWDVDKCAVAIVEAVLTIQRRRVSAEEVAVGLGLGIGTVALLTLLLHYLPGPLPFLTLLVAINLLLSVLFLIPSPTPNTQYPIPNTQYPIPNIQSLIPCTVAAFFRLVNLGYSEFQGDEGIVMMRAARAILGDGAQLFYHQKGPAEVLLPLATWTLSGTINEWQARLPFAFAGILGAVALYLLGRRWLSNRGALIAALLLGINGYFVGFGRIVQYQSIVLATTTLGLLALWRWSEGEGRRWLAAGAALLAFGLLSHYDAGLALPAAAYLVGRRLWAARSQWRVLAVDVLGAGALALGILALFYLPFALHPNFAKTLSYLRTARVGTEGPLYNNLLTSLPLATFYNSTYYLAALAGLVTLASFLPFRRWGLLIPSACCLLLVLQYPIPNIQYPIPNTQYLTWTGPLLTCLIAALLLSRHSSPSSRAAWLWFGAPFLFYYFLVWDPRTHVLNAFPGAALLAALALDQLLTSIHDVADLLFRRRSFQRCSLFIVHCSLLAVFLFLAYYPYLMFVQHDLEIKRTWPDHRPAMYWKPETEGALFGFFGFPYRAGWKAIGSLVEEGTLSGIYASNEEQEVAGWYARGAERTYCPDPEWVLIAQNVQDEIPTHLAEDEAEYHLWGEVQVAGESKLWIYGRGPSTTSPVILHAEDHTSRFDSRTTPANALSQPPADYVPAGHTLGDIVRLQGYRLDTADARPGGSIYLVLYWEPLQPIGTGYQVFNHLYDGTMWGQQDGTPACALRPTSLWEPGQIVRDEYVIPIDPSTPAGDIPLLVGMYHLDTAERLPAHGPGGAPAGDAIPLAEVTVR
jgi:4-amino-4-deoxy-L-arabinose transferase-like glycosyltransferase